MTAIGLPTGFDRPSTGGRGDVRAAQSLRGLAPFGAPGSPPSFAQERYWYLEQMEAGEAVYTIPLALRMRGELDRRALERSLDLIWRRHDVLRTTLRRVGGDLRQVVAPFESGPLAVEDLTETGPADREAAVRSRLWNLVRQPFDFEEGPLVRVRLLRLEPRDHLLLFTAHHAILDGRSYQLIGEEMARLYAALIRLESVDAHIPELQYARFALRQRSDFQGANGARLLAYWTEKLSGAEPVLDLPRDQEPPAPRKRPGSGVEFALSAEAALNVVRWSRAERTTPFVTLLAGFQTLLLRYTGQTDLCVGSIVEGRTRSDEEGVVGAFLNTVVLRTDLSGDPTFRELVRRASSVVFEALDHQDLPFDQLKRALRAQRGAEPGPLFNVLFRSEGPGGSPELPGIVTEAVRVERGATYTDLDMVVRISPNGIELAIRFDTDLFARTTVERMMRHYLSLLEGGLQDPDRPLSRLPLLDEDERRRLLLEWNDTDAPALLDGTIQGLIAHQVAFAPGAVAARDSEGGALGYGELQERVHHMACRLRAAGVRPGDVVGLASQRTVSLLVALLGILEAGAAYLPLDPEFPRQRLDFMLRDSGAAWVLACRRSAPAIPHGAGVAVLLLEELEANVESSVAPSTEVVPGPAAPAYLIYTSGSTGQPKGVVVSQRSVVNFLGAMRRAPGLERGDRVLAVTTLGFDISVLELLLPLTVGATVILASRDAALDGRSLISLMREERITVLQCTPATWRLLIDAGWEGDPPLKALCGGEAMSPGLAGELLARASEVWNLYGPTETTVWSTRTRVRGIESPVPIGHPIENTRVYVLDAAMNPVPPGVKGELWIGGAGVSLGYHGRTDLDDERFLPDPFSAEAGARLYRTGDLARWRSDGSLVCLGRNDHQVKIRGFRIELGEIEAALSRIPGVASCAATVREDDLGDNRLVAYVVPQRAGTVVGSDVRARLHESLPAYMVPSLVVELGALPLTPNGKIDRAKLPDTLVQRSPSDAFRAPSTPTEQIIARVWKELLQVDVVGADDNFFDLGGHSLLSVTALHRIEDETGARLELRGMILQTLAQMAAAADASVGTPATAAEPRRP